MAMAGGKALSSDPAAFDKGLAEKMRIIEAAKKVEAPSESKHESVWKQVVLSNDGSCGRTVKKAVIQELDMAKTQAVLSFSNSPSKFNKNTVAEEQTSITIASQITGIKEKDCKSFEELAIERKIEKAQAQAESGGWMSKDAMNEMCKSLTTAKVTAPASDSDNTSGRTAVASTLDISVALNSLTVAPEKTSIVTTKADKLSKWTKMSFTKASATDTELVAESESARKNIHPTVVDNSPRLNQWGKPMSKANVREGTVIGGSAVAIGEESKGHALMAKMGYTSGTGLGRERKGRLEPVVEVARFSKRGLGAKKANFAVSLEVNDNNSAGSWGSAENVGGTAKKVENSWGSATPDGSWEPAKFEDPGYASARIPTAMYELPVSTEASSVEAPADGPGFTPTEVKELTPEEFEIWCGPSPEEMARRKAIWAEMAAEEKAKKKFEKNQKWRAKKVAKRAAAKAEAVGAQDGTNGAKNGEGVGATCVQDGIARFESVPLVTDNDLFAAQPQKPQTIRMAANGRLYNTTTGKLVY